MDTLQMHLHSDLCRICLFEPKSDIKIKFIHIFNSKSGDSRLQHQILEFLGINVDRDDNKPKIICENCHKSILSWNEMKKKAAESQIVINYISKKLGNSSAINQFHSTEPDSSLDLKNKEESFNTSCLSSHSKAKSSSQNKSIKLVNTTLESDDETSCQEIAIPEEVISISDSDESNEKAIKTEVLKDNEYDNQTLIYCSICKQMMRNHDCSEHNKNFSTCLVPNCNILFRTIRDFTPHFRQHIGMPSGVMLCRFCYQENKKTERDVNGDHIHHSTENLFKCYKCHVKFKNMAEFANHKLKSHHGHLINSAGNYLCFYCEKSSSELNFIADHIKHCRENQLYKVDQKNEVPFSDKQNESGVNETSLIDSKKITKKNKFVGKNVQKVTRVSDYILYTCLKPSCNLVFHNFQVFKSHYRDHFSIGNKLMCWQCCTPFPSLNVLRIHQVKSQCRIPGMFKCFECSEEHDDLQSLSSHKYTKHNGELICKTRKTLPCLFCKVECTIEIYRKHLIECQYKNNKKILTKLPKSKLIKKSVKLPFSGKCKDCGKTCLTLAALTNHRKKHERSEATKILNNSDKIKGHQKSTNSIDKKVTDEVINSIPSYSQNNEGNESDEIVDFDSFPYENNLFYCIKCPKKFVSKTGLIEHWASCSIVGKIEKTEKISKPLRKSYVCSKCKEYFTRISFHDHMKAVHNKKLCANKHKKFSCYKCQIKFIYKLALVMHKEYIHGELDNPVNSKTNKQTIDCTVLLPIMSPTTFNDQNSNKDTTINNSIDQCDVNGKKENELICNMHGLDASKNNAKMNISNNDDNDNEKDNIDSIDNVQKVSQITDELNDCEMMIKEHNNDENILVMDDENILVIDDENEIPENDNAINHEQNCNDKTVIVTNNDETISDITKENSQHLIVDTPSIDTQNIKIVSINDINAIQKLPVVGKENQVTNELNDHSVSDIIQTNSISLYHDHSYDEVQNMNNDLVDELLKVINNSKTSQN